jgi:hypothetical protein
MNQPDLPAITSEELRTYRRAFAPDYAPAFGRQEAYGKNWWTVKNGALYDDCIRRHFVGPTCYAASKHGANGQLRLLASTIAIDIDTDKTDGLPYLVRYDKVLKAFPDAEPIVFSTPSWNERNPVGGLHIYYLTRKPEPRTALLEYTRDRLRGQGLDEQFGHVEILEGQGSLRRLPLGADCYLLDYLTLSKSAPTTLDSFYQLLDLLHHYSAPISIPQGWLPKYSNTMAEKASQNAVERRQTPATVGVFSNADLPSDWLTEGLTGTGQRYALNCELVRHFGLRGDRGNALVEKVVGWYDAYHNGQSRAWLKERQRCIGNIQRLVANYRGPSFEFPPQRKAYEDRRDQLPMRASRDLFDFICRLADTNGTVSEDGSKRLVTIHHEAMVKRIGRSYATFLRGLLKQGLVKVAKEYTTLDGKEQARTYEVAEELFLAENQDCVAAE